MSLERYPIMKYNREYLAMMVKDGVIPETVLRNYDIIKERETGDKQSKQIAIEHGITPIHLSRIIKNCKK